MVQPLHNPPEPTARIEDGQLVLDGFVESDDAVLAVLKEVEDLEAAVSMLLELGARAQRVTAATLDSLVVERTFERLISGFDLSLAGALEQIGEVTSGVVDELEAVFDEDSKTSAQARIEKAIATGAAAHLTSLRKVLDPASEDSPLARLKAEILASVSTQLGLVLKQLSELASGLSAEAARNEAMKLTAIKGFPYEDQVHAVLEGIATSHGDLARQTGHEPGATGRKVGDEVVELAPEDTGGQRVAITFESKHQPLTLRKIHEELDLAIDNREASAAVAVFACQAQAPTSVPFSFHGDRAICVYDPDEGDDGALWLAYMWARWTALRSIERTENEERDLDEAEAAIAEASQALARVTTIKTALTRARNGIDQAGPEVEALRDELQAALGRLRLALGGG